MGKTTTIRLAAFAVSLVALATACADGEELGSGNGRCAQRHGTYAVRYSARSGNCGAGVETIMNVDTQPKGVEPPCTGSITDAPDNCEVEYTTTCPNDGVVVGGELTIVGKSKWSVDAARGSAVESWLVRKPGGTTLCQGTYDVTLERQ